MRNALREVYEQRFSQKEAAKKWGPKAATLHKYFKLREMIGAGFGIESALEAIQLPRSGPAPLRKLKKTR